MARWRLMSDHYLQVPDTKWNYSEVDQLTGRQANRSFDVPLYLSPNNPRDCNREGECVVAYAGSDKPGDTIFTGPPTPEMEPLDDEATAISNKLRPGWEHPIETLPATGLSGSEQAFVDAFAKVAAAQNTSTKGVDPAEFAKLQEQVSALIARNAELEAAATQPKTARRV